jgi:hypothetical protein
MKKGLDEHWHSDKGELMGCPERSSVEIISTFALAHLMRLVLDGAAYDFAKEETKSFILRPFLEA